MHLDQQHQLLDRQLQHLGQRHLHSDRLNLLHLEQNQELRHLVHLLPITRQMHLGLNLEAFLVSVQQQQQSLALDLAILLLEQDS